ncbi:hypothetical protein J4E90_010577 [Alternaria incomplexa]|uniref:uncharacterized protein n=1 Tax=Alternaria incomplexa TaxID=1187928 RepID=UPI00221F68ED|nr:uncharacterized protein J4E90_010577 [Alternaria incomplexa]KAI4906358.1 hypothetical protein J4E90_010577 [Alternaria incomplexa]
MSDPPYALFVLDKSITNEYLNSVLERAYHGDGGVDWDFWVATGSYDDLPACQEVHKPSPNGGTEPPVPSSFVSPWLGKMPEDCAKWLQAMPRAEDTDEKKFRIDTPVNDQYFVFLNEFSKEEDLVFVARVVEEDGEEMRVEYFPQSTDKVQKQMWTNWQFDERAINYQRRQFSNKEPDRSQYKQPKN